MEFGFIGVGAMGGPLARNLIRAGKTVHVYNRSAAGRDKTLAAGTSGVPAMDACFSTPMMVKIVGVMSCRLPSERWI